jgi:hypothetical protein
MSCFNPAFTGPNRCAPYARVGLLPSKGAQGTQWVLRCGRFENRPKDDDVYNGIEMIGHNPATGATCFFKAKYGQKPEGSNAAQALPRVNGRNLPSPDPRNHLRREGAGTPDRSAETLARWMPPKDFLANRASAQCIKCHATYPWIRGSTIPHANVARLTGLRAGTEFPSRSPVPRNFDTGDGAGMDSALRQAALAKKYFVVAQKDLELVTEKGFWQPTALAPDRVPRNARACLTCHRVGGTNFSVRMAGQAMGYCKDYLPSVAHNDLGDGIKPAPVPVNEICYQMNDEAKVYPLADFHKSHFATELFKSVKPGDDVFLHPMMRATEALLAACTYPWNDNCGFAEPRDFH